MIFFRAMRKALLSGVSRRTVTLAVGFTLVLLVRPAHGQVSPAEVLNADLRALEQTYIQQLKTINQSVSKMKFPFPFYLSRFVGLDPAKQAETDSRGLEFVRFQDRVILKVSGNYNAAYDPARLTQNERAAGTFRATVLPILKLVITELPEDLACDGIGFEISHHVRNRESSYDYEGKEIVVVVLDRDDAWALTRAATDPDRQEIVNRSKIYVSGEELGLSLSERDPLNVQALPRSVPAKPDATSTARSVVIAGHSSLLKPSFSPPASSLPVSAPRESGSAATDATTTLPKASEPNSPTPLPTQADADRLGETFQAQLTSLAKLGEAKFHFVDYAPPTFVVFHQQLALQMTLRNSLQFGSARSSIYRRAAQSFDLFLAPQLKDLSEKIPEDMTFQLFDFSVLNRLSPGPKGTSEAIEFICPRSALKKFVDAEITNQQLLDQSVVLVNGVRIALNLQLVE